EPMTPGSMEVAWKQIGMDSDVHEVTYEEATVPVVSGTKLAKPEILFTKLEDDKIAQMEAISSKRVKAAMAKEAGIKEVEIMEYKDEIEYDDFAKLDIRVGKIVTAEKIKKSKKLLRLQVDIGDEEPRQVVAGLAEYYEPEEMVGKVVNVLVNLKPVKLCGVESQGMLLAADAGERVSLLTTDKDMGPGSCIR
ncbi:MAG: methionyl-tRNA synthetase, partial [Methanolobus sp.]|nr:methionyl-tRNA synthetase [Methanolobus sp.]